MHDAHKHKQTFNGIGNRNTHIRVLVSLPVTSFGDKATLQPGEGGVSPVRKRKSSRAKGAFMDRPTIHSNRFSSAIPSTAYRRSLYRSHLSCGSFSPSYRNSYIASARRSLLRIRREAAFGNTEPG